MDLQEIREKWKNKNTNKLVTENLWDSMADGFKDFSIPTKNDNLFIRMVEEKNLIKESDSVLDIGCGAGKYSIVISDKCKSILGIDISSKMIKFANDKAKEFNKTNVNFIKEDWGNLELDKYNRSFDVVFAHMTPAINSAKTFEKMIKASRRVCIMCKPTRRYDSILDEIKKMVGLEETNSKSDEPLLYAIEFLWHSGYLPYLEYEDQVWNMSTPIEKAKEIYINKIKLCKDITSKDEDNIYNYLDQIANDGIVYEKVNTTIAMLYWNVKKGE